MSSKTLAITVVVFAVLIFGGNRYAVQKSDPCQCEVKIVGKGTCSVVRRPCGCKDIGDLQRRIQVANAAINAYKNEIAVMKAQEAKEGKTLEFTQERYNKLQDLIDEAIAQNVHWSGGDISSSNTNAACEIEIDAKATPCMKESLRRHEMVHQRSCKEKKSPSDFLTGKIDWKQKMTLVEVAQEEIDSYTAELEFLDAQLKSACSKQNPCPAALHDGQTISFQDGWEEILNCDSRAEAKFTCKDGTKASVGKNEWVKLICERETQIKEMERGNWTPTRCGDEKSAQKSESDSARLVGQGSNYNPSEHRRDEVSGAQKSEADLKREIGRAWNYNPSEHRGKNGQRFTYVCPAKGEDYGCLGTDIYADNSSLCTAAVHAGLITFERGGTVTIEIRPGQSSYQGSRRNRMNSRSWHAEDGSFVFVH